MLVSRPGDKGSNFYELYADTQKATLSTFWITWPGGPGDSTVNRAVATFGLGCGSSDENSRPWRKLIMPIVVRVKLRKLVPPTALPVSAKTQDFIDLEPYGGHAAKGGQGLQGATPKFPNQCHIRKAVPLSKTLWNALSAAWTCVVLYKCSASSSCTRNHVQLSRQEEVYSSQGVAVVADGRSSARGCTVRVAFLVPLDSSSQLSRGPLG